MIFIVLLLFVHFSGFLSKVPHFGQFTHVLVLKYKRACQAKHIFYTKYMQNCTKLLGIGCLPHA